MQAAYRGDTAKAEALMLKTLNSSQHSIQADRKIRYCWHCLILQVKEAVEKGADVDAADVYGPGPHFPSAICSISGELGMRWKNKI